jgi:hypothetical protein
LLHLWSVAEQGSARALLKERFVDVQEMAKFGWELDGVPSLDGMREYIECLGGTESTHNAYVGMEAAAARWIYFVLRGWSTYSSNMDQQFTVRAN